MATATKLTSEQLHHYEIRGDADVVVRIGTGDAQKDTNVGRTQRAAAPRDSHTIHLARCVAAARCANANAQRHCRARKLNEVHRALIERKPAVSRHVHERSERPVAERRHLKLRPRRRRRDRRNAAPAARKRRASERDERGGERGERHH